MCVNHVYEWCTSNFLLLNVSKTKELLIDFRRSKPDLEKIVINETPVEVGTDYKYLGITIDDKLRFVPHVANQF